MLVSGVDDDDGEDDVEDDVEDDGVEGSGCGDHRGERFGFADRPASRPALRLADASRALARTTSFAASFNSSHRFLSLNLFFSRFSASFALFTASEGLAFFGPLPFLEALLALLFAFSSFFLLGDIFLYDSFAAMALFDRS